MKRIAAVLVSVMLAGAVAPASAREDGYTRLFAVDLDAPLPSYQELQERYGKNNIYDRRYDFSWNIGHKFDDIFARTILTYGTSDKRLKPEGEEMLLAMVEALPPETYPYIGPYLHTVSGMSPKILNLPGIKETKNKFPERIAPQLKSIKNLEFLSPYLYYLLMPEIWPDYVPPATERIPQETTYPKLKYNPGFYAMLRRLVPPESFYPSAEDKQPFHQRQRTLEITPDTPLTTADVKAFVSTLPKVRDFAAKEGRLTELTRAGILVNAYEAEQGKALPLNTLKDLVNPCRRLAQRIRLLGLENEFVTLIGTEGFRLNEWAYTCDRIIKAYRVSKMSPAAVATVLDYKQGIYNKEQLRALPEYVKGGQLAAMFSLVEMYRAPLPDVMSVRPNRRSIETELKRSDYTLAGVPIAVSP